MGYFTRRLGRGEFDRVLFRTPLHPKSQATFGSEVTVDYRGYQEYLGFRGATGTAFISTIRSVESSEPYPAHLVYRNDLFRPVNLSIFIRRPDGSERTLATEQRFPPLASVAQTFIGSSAIQAGEGPGKESVRIDVTPAGLPQTAGGDRSGLPFTVPSLLSDSFLPKPLNVTRDEFFRELSVSPPPDAPPVRGGNVGGAVEDPNADGGGFPTPPSIGGFPVLASDDTWDTVAPTFDGVFQQFSVTQVGEFDQLGEGINFVVSADGDVGFEPIKEAIKTEYPGRSADVLFEKPPEGGNVYVLPSSSDQPEAVLGTPLGSDWPVWVVVDATSLTQANLLLGRFGTRLRLPPQDLQWTFIKAQYVG